VAAKEFSSIVEEVLPRRAAAGLELTGYDVILEADSTGEFIKREPAEPAAWAVVCEPGASSVAAKGKF